MFAIPTSNCVIPYFTLYSGVCICKFNFVVCLQTFPQAERHALCVCVCRVLCRCLYVWFCTHEQVRERVFDLAFPPYLKQAPYAAA